MAFRTTDTLVRGIIETDTADLTPFIRPANILVNKGPATKITDDDQLTEIETWLSAHFCCMLDPRTEASKVGPIWDKFESKVDVGLEMSRYGQQAMLLDTSGMLARLNEQMKTGKLLFNVEPDIVNLGGCDDGTYVDLPGYAYDDYYEGL
jgi:hypothetical protein